MYSSTVTEEERQRYLDQLQAETTITMIPALVFLVTLVVVGLIGNSLVIVIYTRQTKWSSTTVLIITMAFVDLVANVVAIPAEIYDMFHIWQFDNRALCRARLFSTIFTTLTSGMVLFAVAVVRYRKVCKPHNWQVTPRRAEIICIIIIALGVVVSIPYAIINGRQTKKTPRSDIVAYECTTDDEYADTIYPMVYFVFFLLMYVVCCGCLIVMYVLIGIEAWRRRRMYEDNFKTQKQPTQGGMNVASSTTADTNMSAKALVNADRTSSTHECHQRYRLRLFTDQDEVRIPNLGEFFVNLLKKKPELGVVDLHDCVNEMSELDILSCLDCEICRDESRESGDGFTYDSTSQIHETPGATVKKESITQDATMKKKQRHILSNVKWNWTRTERIATDHVFEGGSVEKNMKLSDEFSKAAVTSHSRQMSEITNKSSGNSSMYDRQSLYKEDAIHSNSLSVFKWLDVTSCPDEHDISLNSNAAGNEDNRSPQLYLNRSKAKSTKWLRSSIMQTFMTSHGNSDSVEDKVAAGPNAEIETVNFSKDELESVVDEIFEKPVVSRSSTPNKFGKNVFVSIPNALRRSTFCVETRRNWNRTTVILVVISAIYALGYLPYIGLLFVKLVYPETIQNMSTAGKSIYNLFLRSFFLNSAVNPIVYSLHDIKFRNECNQLLKRS